jgi:hypothetical protein
VLFDTGADPAGQFAPGPFSQAAGSFREQPTGIGRTVSAFPSLADAAQGLNAAFVERLGDAVRPIMPAARSSTTTRVLDGLRTRAKVLATAPLIASFPGATLSSGRLAYSLGSEP